MVMNRAHQNRHQSRAYVLAASDDTISSACQSWLHQIWYHAPHDYIINCQQKTLEHEWYH